MSWNEYGGFIEITDNLLTSEEQTFFPFGGRDPSLFSSGRGALGTLLYRPHRPQTEFNRIKTLFVPSLLCRTVLQFVNHFTQGIEIAPYHIDKKGNLLCPDRMSSTQAIIVLDFFGLNSFTNHINSYLHFPDRVIYDYTLNLYDRKYSSSSNSFASLRKWYGLPDGAICNRNLGGTNPSIISHPNLLIRDTLNKKQYHYFQENEASFARHAYPDIGPSKFTASMLRRINHYACQEARKDNAHRYFKCFKDVDQEILIDTHDMAPLYYPLFLGRDVTKIRQKLIEQKIYIPTLWSDTIGELNEDEKALRDNLLLLPCDFRYGRQDIEVISEKVIKTIKEN